MTPFPLSYKSVLIVDGHSLSAASLGERFRSLGAKVHVVTNASAAAMMVRNIKIDVAFVGHRLQDAEQKLKRVLDEYGVPQITCATARDMQAFAADDIIVSA